jgi:hypothetical protein
VLLLPEPFAQHLLGKSLEKDSWRHLSVGEGPLLQKDPYAAASNSPLVSVAQPSS